MNRKLNKIISVLVCLIVTFQSSVYAVDLPSTAISNIPINYVEIVNKALLDNSDEIVLKSRKVTLPNTEELSEQKWYVVKKTVNKKYIGCGNLIDLDKNSGGIALWFRALCDILYDLTNGKIAANSLLEVKLEPNAEFYLEVLSSRSSSCDKEPVKTSIREGNENAEQTIIDKYILVTIDKKESRIDEDLFNNGNFNLITDLINSNKIKYLEGRDDQYYYLEQDCEAEKNHKKDDIETINKSIHKKVVQLEQSVDIDSNFDLEDFFADENNFVQNTEQKFFIKRNVYDKESQIFSDSKDYNMEVKENFVVEATEYYTADYLTGILSPTQKMFTETQNISNVMSDKNNMFSYSRNGVRVKIASGDIDIRGLEKVEFDEFINLGCVLQADRAEYIDTSSMTELGEKNLSEEEIGPTIESEGWFKESKTVTKWNVERSSCDVKRGSQHIKYDFINHKKEVSSPSVCTAHYDIRHQNAHENKHTYTKVWKDFSDIAGYKNEDTYWEDIKINFKETDFFVKDSFDTEYPVLMAFFPQNIFQEIKNLSLKSDIYDINSLNAEYKPYTFNDVFVQDGPTREGVKYDETPRRSTNDYVYGSCAGWWIGGGIVTVLNKFNLDVDTTYEDWINTAFDIADICFIGGAIFACGKQIVKKMAEEGIKKILTEKGLKTLSREGLSLMARGGFKSVRNAFAKEVKNQVIEEVGEKTLGITTGHEIPFLVKPSSLGFFKPGRRVLLPKQHWVGKRGNSLYKPPRETIPDMYNRKHTNPFQNSWGEIFDKYGIEGIEYKNNVPNFAPVSQGSVRIKYFTADRSINFKQARSGFAKQFNKKHFKGRSNWTEGDVQKYIEREGLTFHESASMKTIDLVPSSIHGNCPHIGGVGIKKTEEYISGKFNELLYKIDSFVA